MKPWRMKWTRYVACIGEKWKDNLQERDHLKNLEVDKRIMLETIKTLNKQHGTVWAAVNLWYDVGNMEMNLRVAQDSANIMVAEQVIGFPRAGHHRVR
jgi:hypothetical protein